MYTLYYTVLYYTILYYTILYYTILYYTILDYTPSDERREIAGSEVWGLRCRALGFRVWGSGIRV